MKIWRNQTISKCIMSIITWYEISENEEFHERMQNDANFATSYINEVLTSQTINDNSQDQDGMQVNGLNDDTEEQDAVTEDIDDNSTWTDAATKLLIHEYLIRKDKFRKSKIKKIYIWREMATEFTKRNFNFTADQLSKKFNNMKTTYSKKKKNNFKRSTGMARQMWPWLKPMDEIFHADLSINFGTDAITSMPTDNENTEVLNLSTSSASPESASNASDGSMIKASSSNVQMHF